MLRRKTFGWQNSLLLKSSRNLSQALVLISFSLLVVGCNNNDGRRKLVMQEIASKVVLPPGARQLSHYSQYYSVDPQGDVEAIYIINTSSLREEVKAECLNLNKKSYPCDQEDYGVIVPGKAKWVKSRDWLPGQEGGGCSAIFIHYDTKTSSFISVECNGDR